MMKCLSMTDFIILSHRLIIFCHKQHKTIDSVLARGERLDSLVEKSSDLSAASQVTNTAPVLQLLGLAHECILTFIGLKLWSMWLWY